MPAFAYSVLDVFTAQSLRGNPLALVHGANALDADAMQALARWTQLSETAFLLTPTDPAADYRVRIFTPGGELPFAGHPTLGSCAGWLHAGGHPRTPGEVIQECGVGLVRLKALDAQRWAFAAPPCQITEVEPDLLAQVMQALGLAPAQVPQVLQARWLDNGPRWLGLQMASDTLLHALQPDHARLKALGVKVGVAALRAPDAETALEVRAFAAAIGIEEDPVTGSLQAALAQWLIGEGVLPDRYVSAQGAALQRDGRVHVERLHGQVWVGGDVQVCITGQLSL